MTKGVMTTHGEYDTMVPFWETMQDSQTCAEVIKSKRDRYLTKLDGMSADQFEAYAKRGAYPLYTKHVIHNFVGMSLRKDVMTTNIDETLEKNIDGKGGDLTNYVRMLVGEYLTYGRGATLVEYTTLGPKLVFYDKLSLRNWKTKVINGQEKLSLVVLRESVDKGDEFSHDTEYQYRVLRLIAQGGKWIYVQEKYDHGGELIVGSRLIPKMRFKPMEFIPCTIHGGITVKYPPLLAIAEQNYDYFRLSCDYRHGLHYTALPTPYVKGVAKDEPGAPTAIGPSELWYLPEEGDAGMLEFSGKGLGEIAKELDRVDDTIVVLSSRVLAPPKTINETATAAAIRNAGETASLAEIVGMLSVEMTDTVNMAMLWKLERTDATVKINNDFIPTILSGADVASYVASWLKSGMSYHTLFSVLKKGEIVEGDRDISDELADIEAETKKRMEEEVAQAEKLAEVEGKAQSKYQEPGKDGEQVNKGQNFKEN